MKCMYRRNSIIFGLAAMVVAATLYAATGESDPRSRHEAPTAAAASASDLSTAFRAAANEVLPSVVTIESRQIAAVGPADYTPKSDKGSKNFNPYQRNPLEEKFGGSPFGKQSPRWSPPDDSSREASSMGSGVIYDASGLILTNHHVIAAGGELTVRLADGREFPVVEVWSDSKTDIAVVRIEGATGLPAARLGNSDHAEIGDWVLALGQPFGLESTVTAGIISAKHRGIGITEREDFLQTDAAINPGNSGGPLINLNGEVIGINTAISSRTGGNTGIGFAVPMNLARWVAGQLTANGTVERAYIGVMIQAMTPELAARFGVSPREGVLLADVLPDTPAAEAGLRSGDMIVMYDGQSVSTPSELQLHVERSEVGQPLTITAIRDGSRIEMRITPAAQSTEHSGRDHKPSKEGTKPTTGVLARWGVEVETLDPAIAKRLGLEDVQGVVVTGVRRNSPADRAGLESGMVITQVNRAAIRTVEDVAAAIRAGESKDGVLLLIRHHDGSRFIVLTE